MSSTNPPDPNVNTFNNLYWISGDTALTQDVADKRYLRFPTAQGTENLAAINVNGLATFNTDIIVADATNSTSSIIEQNNLSLRIGSCSNSATPNSILSLYATDAGGVVVEQVRITNASTQINNPANFSSNVSIGSATSTNLTPVVNTNKADLQIGTGGQGLMDIECPVSIGGFGSLTLTTAPLNLAGGARINQSAAPTSNNTLWNTDFVKPLTMTGTLNTDRIINNVYYQLQDQTNLATTTGQIYASSGIFNYDNDANGGSHNFATNTAGGVQTIPLSFNSVDMSISTTNPPTCAASSTILLTDDSTKLPSTAWVRDYVSSVSPVAPITLTTTATTTGYNAGGNYTYWYFATYPSWNAYSWVFNTPTTSKTNVNKNNLGSSPPLNVGTIGANGSFIFMTGNGISQGYTATSSTMITYCGGFQQQYTISSGANAAILSIINCIGATPAAAFFQSNQLAENNGTCPPSAFGLSGYIVLQALNGDYTGLGTPTITYTQIIA
jgi:hypothetical protein